MCRFYFNYVFIFKTLASIMRYEFTMLPFVITGNACFEATLQTNLALLMILKALALIMRSEFHITVFVIKYYSPKVYSAQKRAVTPRDYEAIIKQIYPEI